MGLFDRNKAKDKGAPKDGGTKARGGSGQKGSSSLDVWKERLNDSDREFLPEVQKMRERELLYAGEKRELKPFTQGDVEKGGGSKSAPHVRNIIFENIEAQISSSIPQPKVTPRKEDDEQLAETTEHFLRNELDRMPFEIFNDLAERAVPIHGGVAWHVEWDNEAGTHDTVGDIVVSVIHPMQLAPQPGVYTHIQDMDWIILKIPTTKEAVRRKYGVDIEDEGESEPEVRTGGDSSQADDAVTQYIGYARNDGGGIDRCIWVNDTVLEFLEDYQARKSEGQSLDFESVYSPITTGSGLEIPGEQPVLDEFGDMQYETDAGGMPVIDEYGMPRPSVRPSQVPYYKPDMYPIVLQKNVSVYGQLMGNSDVDIIRDQQETVNRMHKKVIDRLIKAGSKITAPNDTRIRWDTEDCEVIRLENPAEAAAITVKDLSGDISYILTYLEHVYNEGRQMLGVTDSFQGRKDTTATSGKAKEFAAAQTAGRLESKRVMKDAAYADLFELMFKFALAYSDEPRTIVHKNARGVNEYSTFDRYDFLSVDESGEYYWDDQFLFSCDASAPLASNREAMWQEMRMNLQTGAFGDPRETETLVMFWGKMEMLHYPYAGMIRKQLEDKLQAQQQAAMGAGMGGGPGSPGMPPGGSPGGPMGGLPAGGVQAPGLMPGMMPDGELPPTGYMDGGPQLPGQVIDGIERQAMEDAARDAGY